MSGLEGLGIACNILQIISFTAETVRLCHSVYEGRSPGGEMLPNATALQALTTSIEPESTKQKKSWTTNEQSLIDVSRKCKVAAKAVVEEVNFLTKGHKQGDLAATLKVAAKTNWRKRRLKRLEDDLKKHQDLLETHILVRVCRQSDALILIQQTGFAELDQTLQSFISQFAAGNTNLESLVTKSSDAMRAHIDTESKRMQQAVGTLIVDQASSKQEHINRHTTSEIQGAVLGLNLKDQMQQSSVAKERSRETLLKSFKFEDMNLRSNQLSEGHQGTFAWIWDRNLTDDENSSSDAVGVSGGGESPDAAESPGEMNASGDADSNDSFVASERSYVSSTSPPEMKYWSESNDVDSELWNDFQEWLKSEDSIYWISGKPGSGKSTLVKYLVNSSQTMEALRAWMHGPEVLSYFLWKPGSLLQQSLKGLLCTLLHQIFLAHPVLLDFLIEGRSIRAIKESPSDWTIKELRELFLGVLSTKETAFCIFVDGLDEACDETHEDGLRPLLKLIWKLASMPCVKVCVASRPEPKLQRAFGSCQSLRLQDLTRGDVRLFVIDSLHLMKTDDDCKILFGILEKAEGVFLWVRLAVKSLQDGLDLGDSSEELIQRLNDLPSELADLYEELWQRNNGDSCVYRQQAAQMLNLLIDNSETTTFAYGVKSTLLLELALLVAPEIQFSILNGTLEDNLPIVLKRCEVLFKSFTARCGGLAEIVPKAPRMRLHDPTNVSQPLSTPDGFQFPDHVHYRAIFIHRTAVEFLRENAQGARILSYDSTSTLRRRFLKVLGWAGLCTLQPYLNSTVPRPCLDTTLIELAKSMAGVSQRDRDCLIRLCWHLWDQGLLRMYSHFGRWEATLRRPHFLSLVARRGEFHAFVLTQVKESSDPPALAAAIIGNLFAEWTAVLGLEADLSYVSSTTDCFDFIRNLLSWPGTVAEAPYFTQLNFTGQSILGPQSCSPRSRDYIPFSTPLGSFLTQTLTRQMPWSERIVLDIISYLGLLDSQQPDYEEELCLVAEGGRLPNGEGGPRTLYTSMWTERFHRQHVSSRTEPYRKYAYLAIQANAAYWITFLAEIVRFHLGVEAVRPMLESIRDTPPRVDVPFLITEAGKPPYPRCQQLKILDESTAKSLADTFTASWNEWTRVGRGTSQTDLESTRIEGETLEVEDSSLEWRQYDFGDIEILSAPNSDSESDWEETELRAMLSKYASEGAAGSPSFSMHTSGLLEYLCDHGIGYIRGADLEAKGYKFVNGDFWKSEA